MSQLSLRFLRSLGTSQDVQAKCQLYSVHSGPMSPNPRPFGTQDFAIELVPLLWLPGMLQVALGPLVNIRTVPGGPRHLWLGIPFMNSMIHYSYTVNLSIQCMLACLTWRKFLDCWRETCPIPNEYFLLGEEVLAFKAPKVLDIMMAWALYMYVCIYVYVCLWLGNGNIIYWYLVRGHISQT